MRILKSIIVVIGALVMIAGMFVTLAVLHVGALCQIPGARRILGEFYRGFL